MERPTTEVRSAYFDEMSVGQQFDAPSVTLTGGLQAAHSAIVGNRQRLVLDHELATAVVGGPLASPALVCDIAIGQSTVATQHVKANLFYRGLVFRRHPLVGDTLRTTTTVEGLKENARRDGRQPTGLVLLRIRTLDQAGHEVLDFRRCAMVLLSPAAPRTSLADDLEPGGSMAQEPLDLSSISGWDLSRFRRPEGVAVGEGDVLDVLGGDVVSSAPELARLTGNLARVHHDEGAAGGRRLVYGGHTIGLALHHVSQALPGLLTVLGWRSCTHVAPVHEGDVLASSVQIERVHRAASGFMTARLRVLTRKVSGDGAAVLDWRPDVALAPNA